MFANHINVLITDIDVGALQNKVDRVIVELKSWFQRNDLKINVHKTVGISLHSRQKKVPVGAQVTCSTIGLKLLAAQLISYIELRLNSWESILRRN